MKPRRFRHPCRAEGARPGDAGPTALVLAAGNALEGGNERLAGVGGEDQPQRHHSGKEGSDLHLLPGEDPVFTWISGTGARPVLQALPDGVREEFEGEYKQLLRDAYPPLATADGSPLTVLPFRRVFAVARRE